MANTDLIDVTLTRGEGEEVWGFSLAGGKDFGQPLSISQVIDGSLSAKLGLENQDLVVEIAGQETEEMTNDQAERAIQDAGNMFNMVIARETDRDRKISFEKSAASFSLKLGGGGPEVEKECEAFISNVAVTEDTPALLEAPEPQDSVNLKKPEKPAVDMSKSTKPKDTSKPHMRRDWNTPWVRKDGMGLKQAIRAIDGPTCPVKTSLQHFYSEPRSILTPEPTLTQEELQKVIAEHGCDSPSKMFVQDTEHSISRSRPHSRQDVVDNNVLQRQDSGKVDFAQFNGESQHSESHSVTAQSTEIRTESIRRINEEESYGREREEDSQAPPPLETVEQNIQQSRESGYIEENGMGVYDDEGYEPSADELIDVLKNLENLAAANPALYKAIVEQIKVNTGKAYEGDRRSPDQGNISNNSGKISTVMSPPSRLHLNHRKVLERFQGFS